MIHNYPGILITLEGIDGSGKSSIALALAQLLKSEKYSILVTKEPGATPLGMHLRNLLQQNLASVCPKAEFLLFAADRAQHVDQVVKPALAAGTIVISDRMADSSYAYQGYGRGLDRNVISQVNTWALGDVQPDLTIYLSIDYETSQQRIAQRKQTKTVIESEEKEFFDKVIFGFNELFSKRSNVITIDSRPIFEVVVNQLYEKVVPYVANIAKLKKNRVSESEDLTRFSSAKMSNQLEV